jgi:hypothetical protein
MLFVSFLKGVDVTTSLGSTKILQGSITKVPIWCIPTVKVHPPLSSEVSPVVHLIVPNFWPNYRLSWSNGEDSQLSQSPTYPNPSDPHTGAQPERRGDRPLA